MTMSMHDTKDAEWHNQGDEYENEYFTPLRFGVYHANGELNTSSVTRKDDLYVEIEGIVKKPDKALCVGYALYDQAGTRLYWTYHSDQINSPDEVPVLDGHVVLRSRIPLETLNLGTKRIELWVQTYRDNWLVGPVGKMPFVSFTIEGPASTSPYYVLQRSGLMAINAGWHIKED